MPIGTWIQFRYARGLVPPPLLAGIGDKKTLRRLRGAPTLINYLDLSDPLRNPEVVPCRIASLVDVVPLGSTVSLQLELADFALASDISRFNEDLAALAGDVVPKWDGQRVRGSFWFEVNGELHSVTRSSDMAVWENLVEQIAERKDFEDEPFFYAIQDLLEVGPDRPVPAKKNLYKLRPNREYDVRIYHFHPTHGEPQSLIGLETSHPSLSFTTNPRVLLDSRYDLKRIRLRTMSPVSREPGVLAVRRQTLNQPEWAWEFDLPIQVRGTFWRKLALGLLIGTFLAVSPIVSANSNPNLSAGSRLVISLVSTITGILAGIAAAFGLRRSL